MYSSLFENDSILKMLHGWTIRGFFVACITCTRGTVWIFLVLPYLLLNVTKSSGVDLFSILVPNKEVVHVVDLSDVCTTVCVTLATRRATQIEVLH